MSDCVQRLTALCAAGTEDNHHVLNFGNEGWFTLLLNPVAAHCSSCGRRYTPTQPSLLLTVFAEFGKRQPGPRVINADLPFIKCDDCVHKPRAHAVSANGQSSHAVSADPKGAGAEESKREVPADD